MIDKAGKELFLHQFIKKTYFSILENQMHCKKIEIS